MAESKDIIIRPNKGFQEQFAASNVDVVFGGGILAGGKLQPLDSLVLTPSGWRRMGEIHIGSDVLTPFDGVATVTSVIPQGVQDVYEVETTDGRKCECGLDHLWAIRTYKQMSKYRNAGKPWRWITTVTTKDLISMLSAGKKCYIPLTHGVEFEERDLPISPYALGALIGDGCLTGMKGETCIRISNSEDDVINKVAKELNATRIYRQTKTYTKCLYIPAIVRIKQYLMNCGLATYSYDKFIPYEYLHGSIEQRRQLLFGLMDTDGSVETRHNSISYSYSTTSERLKNDFVELCRSLGYKPIVSVDKRTWKYTRKKAYDITIMTDDVIVSSLKHLRKVNSIDFTKRKYGHSNDHAIIKSIKRVGRKECQCIVIDSPKHLYITDDYITTHNSFSLVLAMAEPLMTDSNFRALISRKSLGSLKSGGGFVDTFQEIFGEYVNIKQADSPRAAFPSGAYCDLTYIDDSNLDKMRERAKGWQYDVIAIDEITEMSWEAFSYIQTRNRGRSKTFTGKFFATLNPKRSHWTRTFLDWYIGMDGFVRPERDGVVRYFYIAGSSVKDVVWGDSKEEVYTKCKVDIDRKLKRVGGQFSYKNMIKSFVFYQGKLSENTALLKNNPDYIGSVAASGGRMAQALIEGNFNVDPEEEESLPIPSDKARDCFVNDAAMNGDKWITADLADFGTDNLVALAWNGFHVIDIMILGHTTPRDNAIRVREFARENGVADSHIIFDATAGRYFKDYIPDSIPYMSSAKPRGIYFLQAMYMKDLCYLRLVKMIGRGELTFSEKVAQSIYTHQNLKYRVTVENEFLEECAVVRFLEQQSGKKRLMSKKQMNAMLGHRRSMDLLDPCAMRMLPCVNLEYGRELEEGFKLKEAEAVQKGPYAQSIYDETLWS